MDEKSIASQTLTPESQFEPQTELQIDTRVIVLQLKAALKSKGLTVQDLIDMCEGKPNMPSETSIKRVFAPGSENKSFNYRLTLKPLVKELLEITPEATVVPPSASEEQHEIAALKSVILAKEQICSAHEARIASLVSHIDRRDSELQRQADLFTKRIEKLDTELDKVKAENEEYKKEKKEAEKASIKAAKARKFWTTLTIIILAAFVLYLLFFDVPNPEFGLFSVGAVIDEIKAAVSGSHTAGDAVHAVGWLRV